MRVDLATVVFGWEKPLGVADHLLSKVSETATAQGRSESEILEWRLAPDMFTLAQQFQSVTRLVGEWSARAVGADVPPDLPAESVGDLRTAISSTRQCLSALSPHQFSNRDEIPLTVDLGLIHPTLTTGQWILGFATTNILFHLSIAYAILRSNGVPLGKPDLFAGGL